MAWVRIDDAVMDHPKVLLLSAEQFRLWIRGLCYCQKHLTDGFIPGVAMKPMFAKTGDVKRLCAVGLWQAVTEGFQVHDFLDWNDSRDMTTHRKRLAKDRQQAWRETHLNNAPAKPINNAVTNGVTNTVTNGVPHLTSVHLSTPQEQKPPPTRGSQHGRIFVHPWQLHALIDTLGPHAPAFGLDEWVFGLSTLADASGLVLEKRDVWGWVQQQLSEEIQRRGLPVAGAVPSEASILARAREEIDRQNAAVRRG